MNEAFEKAAKASKAAWDEADYDTATVQIRRAREAVQDAGTVVQLHDGVLQFVPNETPA